MSVFLDLPAAIADEATGVAAHYGEPLREQRALEGGTAVVDLSHRGIVVVSGDDRLSWLNSMTSQQLTGLRPGESTETLLLDPNGRIEYAIRVVDDGTQSWLLVDEGLAERLTAFLTRMRFALRVVVANRSEDFAVVGAFGNGAALRLLRELNPEVEWVDPWQGVQRGGVQYARGEHAGAHWEFTQCVFARDRLAAVTAGLGPDVRAAGLMALAALEVRAWRPTQHGDLDERSIAHEFDWMRTAVHLTKGCYRGQETVAKVHNLGRPPRRLTLLHLDGFRGELPVPGALVYLADTAKDPEARPVGRITRATLHYEWGGIALALLKRSVPEDAELEVRSGDAGADPKSSEGDVIAASQEVIVPADAGASRDIPRLKRL
ncbi:folate-binding protein YgfZ [Leucobacter exalbidus]|uniref:Folate-binding protein YgfZ n=1 Tax=Leucobacter exalbidus TaxID=662960 RepID=A0A940T4P8_9MICO|nr:folate-binding protein YgfZ [Leucobacter exalbidus]MBP1327168.1 folate-binding protein YgfZ [Leucobacter exalbidus]